MATISKLYSKSSLSIEKYEVLLDKRVQRAVSVAG